MDMRSKSSSSSSSRCDESGEYALITHEKCNVPRAKLFLVCVISFIVAALVVLLVVLTRLEQNDGDQNTGQESCWFSDNCTLPLDEQRTCADVAVIGGGLAGAYATWRMIRAKPNGTVVLYEASDRIGGRFHTLHLPNISQINLEAGASYFLPAIHPTMNSTVAKLGLEVMAFSPGFHQDEALYMLRGVRLRAPDLNSTVVPYNMDESENHQYPYDLLRQSLTECENCSMEDGNNKSLKQFLMERISHEAYSYLSATIDQRDFNENAHRKLAMESALRMRINAPLSNMADRKTLIGGMDILPRKLAYESTRLGAVQRLRHELIELAKSENSYHLTFNVFSSIDQSVTKETMCSHSVVLALPPAAINALQWDSQGSWLKRQLSSPLEVNTITMFVTFDAAWWQSPEITIPWKAVHSDLPVGDVTEVSPVSPIYGVNISVLMLTVSKPDQVHYWRSLLDSHQTILVSPDINSAYVAHVKTHLSSLADDNGITAIPSPLTVIVYQWDSTIPYSSGTNLWKPNDDWSRTSQRISQPSPDESVYIVGSSFAPGDLQLWGEGAMQTVNKMIDTFFAK